MPDAAYGDVFNLTLEDGRILECQVLNQYATYCAVLDGPRSERRHHRRPAPSHARISIKKGRRFNQRPFYDLPPITYGLATTYRPPPTT